MAVTQQQLEQVYKGAVLAENPNLQPSLIQGQDLYFKMVGVAIVVATVVPEVQNLQNNIIPSSSSSTFLYKHAASLGIPILNGAMPTLGTIYLVSTDNAPSSFIIPEGTILSNTATSVQYQTTKDVNVLNGTLLSTVALPFISVLSGKNTYSPPGTQVTLATPLVLSPTITVTLGVLSNDIVAGSDLPTTLDISQLVTSYMQNPRGGGSSGDYYKWCLASNPTLVTNAVIIPAGEILEQNIIYNSIMSGSGDPNVNINLAYPISRSINDLAEIAITENYLNSLRPENDNPRVATVKTYLITDVAGGNPLNCSINIGVVLSPGLSLSTLIVGTNGETKTVEDWIKYQARWGVLASPYKGTLINGLPYILGTTIITALMTGLADTNSLKGYLCSILVDAIFTYSDNDITNISNIPVPDSDNYFIPPTITTPPYLEIIYDLDVGIVNVGIL